MGIGLADIPRIGELEPSARRELARWLRTPFARGSSLSPDVANASLAASPWAPHATLDRLLAVGWLEPSPGGYHADTYARRIAAGAVGGARMSVAQAHALARTVAVRIAAASTNHPDVRIVRAVVYGSAVRDKGNLLDDIGDLDIALELSVESPWLEQRLRAVPEPQRWRQALRWSGLETAIMQGDDRVTLAGSLARVLDLFWKQVNGRDIPADGRKPALICIWPPSRTRDPDARFPMGAADHPPGDLDPPPPWHLALLGCLEARTLAENERARLLSQELWLH